MNTVADHNLQFSDESLDELSDDDIDAEQDGEHWNADDKQRLFVVGSRQKLHCPYDVPNLKADISVVRSFQISHQANLASSA